MKRRGAQSLQKEKQSLQERAAALSAAKEGDRLSAICLHDESVALKAEADELRRVDEAITLGAGGEVLPTPEGSMPSVSELAQETLLHPDAVNIGASSERLDLAEKAGVSELAVDAAESIQAQNSLEKMLVHQMAACHKMAMDMSQRSTEQQDPVEAARLANASAKMMQVYQTGCLALHKMRTGGKQVVVVQHVHVTKGGQAVVAGTVKGRGSPNGGRE